MDRRTFLRSTPMAAGCLFAGCAGNRTVEGWAIPAQDPAEDIRMRILRYAVLAPSSHNAQPWLLEVGAPAEMTLRVDRGRLLPRTDPFARQIHISQGAFLETLDIAARQFGYLPKIEYFPDGDSGSGGVEEKPVARISLGASSSTEKDPLFGSILARHTNKLRYDGGRSVPDAHWSALEAETKGQTVAWRRVTDAGRRRVLTAMLRDAMEIEVSSRERNQETAEWFRFSDDETAARRDGFGVAQSGASGLKKWVAERVLPDRKGAADPGGLFARSAVDQTEEQAGSAPAFAALVTSGNSRLDQVLAGRAYTRVQLAATRLGLRMQPFSQALEEYPEMQDLQRRLKSHLAVDSSHTIQMLFRLGHAAPGVHTPRRDPASMVRRWEGRA